MSKILIVDDDPDIIQWSTMTLEKEGYTVISAYDGAEGYEKAKAEKPDLMLLDVMMTHDTEGFDVARKMKEDATTKGIPVILVTGIRKAKTLPFKFEPDEEWLPVKAVLEKPVKSEELLSNVAEALKV